VRRAFKIIGWSFGVLVLLIGLTGVAAYVFVTSDYVRAQIETRAGAISGRKTKIAKISIDWGLVSHVHLDAVEVANADWGKADHMFKAEQIEFQIRVWPLIHGDFILPKLTLRKPEIYLERNAEDESNWSPKESPVVSGAAQKIQPKNRYQTPLIGQLEINVGRLGYRDTKRNLDLDGTVQTATGQASAQSQAELSLKGRLEGQPLSLHFVGGSALMLRETDTPYPIALNVAHGDTKLGVKGSLQDPFQYKGADVELSLSGSDLADIYPLLGIPGPPTPPYRITGKLHREPDTWRVVDMAWHTGDSDLSGDVAIDQQSKPSRLTAHLVSQRLVFADLAPLIGATPGKRSNQSAQQKQTEAQLEATGDLFPNVPLHVERLRAMDMDVTLEAKRVVAPSYLPVQAIAARVQVQSGQALVRPLDMTFGGGKIVGDLAVDARTDNPAVRTIQPGKPPSTGRRPRRLLPRLAFLRHDRGQAQGPRSVDRHWPIARSGHGYGQRRCRTGYGRWIDQWADGQSRQSADRRCIGSLYHRRRPYPDPVRPQPPELQSRRCGLRQDADGHA
jgi:AsmA family protein